MYLTKFKVKKVHTSLDSKVSRALQSETVYVSQMSLHLDTLALSTGSWQPRSGAGSMSGEGDPLAVIVRTCCRCVICYDFYYIWLMSLFDPFRLV